MTHMRDTKHEQRSLPKRQSLTNRDTAHNISRGVYKLTGGGLFCTASRRVDGARTPTCEVAADPVAPWW